MPATPLQFRPSIILFVEEACPLNGVSSITGADAYDLDWGRSVYGHFCNLCAGLNPAVKRGIGLIHVTGDMAVPLPLRTTQDALNAAKAPLLQRKADSIGRIFSETVKYVRSPDTFNEITRQYPMPDINPQIIIVGSTQTNQTMYDVVQEISKTQLHIAGADGFPRMYYLIADVPKSPDPRATSRWTDHLRDIQREVPTVRFGFLFEHSDSRSVYHEANEVYFSMAESLFGLVALALPETEIFRTTTNPYQRNMAPDERLGSLGAGMIRFPRAEVTEYCARRLSSFVLQEWGSISNARALQPEELAKDRYDAFTYVNDMRGQLADVQTRMGYYDRPRNRVASAFFAVRQPRAPIPGQDVRCNPNFAFLAEEIPDSLRRHVDQGATPSDLFKASRREDALSLGKLNEASESLFGRISYDTVNSETGNTWPEQAWNTYVLAGNLLRDWCNVAGLTWKRAGDRMRYQTAAMVDGLWLDHSDGFLTASAFVRLALGRIDPI